MPFGTLPEQAREITTVTIDGSRMSLGRADGGRRVLLDLVAAHGQLPGDARASVEARRRRPCRPARLHGDQRHVPVRERLAPRRDYSDGRETEIPFVWVTEPIGAGFYLFHVEARAGHEARECDALRRGRRRARDAADAGHARGSDPGSEPRLPASAGFSRRPGDLGKARVALRRRTRPAPPLRPVDRPVDRRRHLLVVEHRQRVRQRGQAVAGHRVAGARRQAPRARRGRPAPRVSRCTAAIRPRSAAASTEPRASSSATRTARSRRRRRSAAISSSCSAPSTGARPPARDDRRLRRRGERRRRRGR